MKLKNSTCQFSPTFWCLACTSNTHGCNIKESICVLKPKSKTEIWSYQIPALTLFNLSSLATSVKVWRPFQIGPASLVRALPSTLRVDQISVTQIAKCKMQIDEHKSNLEATQKQNILKIRDPKMQHRSKTDRWTKQLRIPKSTIIQWSFPKSKQIDEQSLPQGAWNRAELQSNVKSSVNQAEAMQIDLWTEQKRYHKLEWRKLKEASINLWKSSVCWVQNCKSICENRVPNVWKPRATCVECQKTYHLLAVKWGPPVMVCH